MFRRISSILPFKEGGSTSTALTQPRQEANKTEQPNEPAIELIATGSDIEGQLSQTLNEDVFGNEEGAEIQYKTCDWW